MVVDLGELTAVGLFSFGGVWLISYVLERYFNKTLDTTQKFILMAIIAFGVGYVPADLTNELANRIKDAVAVAIEFSGLYQGGKKIVSAVRT